jgi:hypothetical protein
VPDSLKSHGGDLTRGYLAEDLLGGGVHDQVIDDALVHASSLETSHSIHPVGPAALPGGGDLGGTTNPDPHHGQTGQG